MSIGSLLDKYDSPIHYSMRHIHNMMRNILSDLSRLYENYHTLTLSVSTVASTTEILYRKYADQTYWLTGSEVVDKAVDSINKWQHVYEDIPIYKKHPLYETYFKHETVEQRIERFKKEIGLQ